MKSPPPFSTSRCDVGVTPHGPGGKADVEEAVREIFTPPPFSTSGCGVGGAPPTASTRAWSGGHAPERLADMTFEQPGDMDKTFEQPADMTFGYVFKATCST